MKKEIYFDHAATTKMWPQVQGAMEPYLGKDYGNASTAYDSGKKARAAIKEAREHIADDIGAKPKEIFFTSGGSESDNWAIKCAAGAYKSKGTHIITTSIEHHAVLNSCKYLERLGYQVTYLPVNSYGEVSPQEFEAAIRKDTTFATIMFGNNEIGTIEPIAELGNIAKKHQVIFHTDAVQAVGQVPMDVKNLPIDALSASAHKFHGPKGIGFLYVKEAVDIPSFIHGGGQEQGKRAGTENVAAIVGMATALDLSTKSMQYAKNKTIQTRDYLIWRVMNECKDVKLNGHATQRLPGNASFSFYHVNATALLVLLEEEGICASSGSACSTGDANISHVITAIGVDPEYGNGTIRFSLGAENSFAEVDYVVKCLKEAIHILRMI